MFFKLGHWGVQRVQKQGPHFLAFSWAATAGKIGLKRQRLGSQKDLSFSS
jgi:hypothetical protein